MFVCLSSSSGSISHRPLSRVCVRGDYRLRVADNGAALVSARCQSWLASAGETSGSAAAAGTASVFCRNTIRLLLCVGNLQLQRGACAKSWDCRLQRLQVGPTVTVSDSCTGRSVSSPFSPPPPIAVPPRSSHWGVTTSSQMNTTWAVWVRPPVK